MKRGGYMKIEVAWLISFLSATFAVYSGMWNLKRNQKSDDKRDATEMTTVIVKLESISGDTSEIKKDMSDLKSEMKELRERVVVVEQSTKQSHKRIDEWNGRKKE